MTSPSGFHDVIFPLSVAFGASGGPQRQTDIIELANGSERRNSSLAHSRRRYNAAAGIKNLDDLHDLIAFFEARRGALYGFRFKDPLDHQSCRPSQTPHFSDQFLGTGDGESEAFQLVKHYGDSADSWVRPISKPVEGQVSIAIDDVEVPAADYVINYLSGIIHFDNSPAQNVRITAGFSFHVPVRFDTDQLDLSLEAFGAGEIRQIPLIEIPYYA